MTKSSTPVAYMLRCRQASTLSPRNGYLRKPPPRVLLRHQSHRAASTSPQAPAAAAAAAARTAALPPPPPTTTPPGNVASQRSLQDQTLRAAVSPSTQTLITQRPTLWTSIKSLFGFRPPSAPSRINALNNPYRARKKWPPDFRTLHPKHQFHYEKTYRRRIKLKYIRPRWIKGTKAVQYVLSVSIVIYWIFFLQVEGKGGTIFDAIRARWSELTEGWEKLPEDSGRGVETLSRPRVKQNADN